MFALFVWVLCCVRSGVLSEWADLGVSRFVCVRFLFACYGWHRELCFKFLGFVKVAFVTITWDAVRW